MLSVVSWFTPPFNATYAASKHTALAVSDAARIQLKPQGTQVLGVYAGYIDTEGYWFEDIAPSGCVTGNRGNRSRNESCAR
jgi:short-subunit dehydrogenase